ncbi:MAG: ABC transporter ATP-binding protein [Limnochordia bacterium]|jgi:oligopeptide/dipeptide ABC transporter ATP-binding protein
MKMLVEVKDLRKLFPLQSGVLERLSKIRRENGKLTIAIDHVHAVDGISFGVKKGETLGLVGESGCGKSTTGRLIIRLLEPTSGKVLFKGQDITTLSDKELLPYRRKMQMIFQEPSRSLNPRDCVGEAIGEPLMVNGIISNRKKRRERVEELMAMVGLDPKMYSRFPHKFSGGEKQRIMMARVLSLNPEFIVMDEPTASLDVSLQAQTLKIFKDLQKQHDLTYLFISHNLATVKYFCDRIAVMYLGKIAEIGDADKVYQNPVHPYTKALLSALPVAKPGTKRNVIELKGSVANPVNPGPGCRFVNRCPFEGVTEICRNLTPELEQLETGHDVACHFLENDLRIEMPTIRL